MKKLLPLLPLLLAARLVAAEFTAVPVPWQQAPGKPVFTVFPDREEYSQLDRALVIGIAVQAGKDWPAAEQLATRWTLRRGAEQVATGEASLASGMTALRTDPTTLAPGGYELTAALVAGARELTTATARIRIVAETAPPTSGRIALRLPRAVPAGVTVWPVSGGIPFPKGALWQPDHVRVVDAAGQEVPTQALVRARWDSSPASSIRWLAVDFQARPGTEYALLYDPAPRVVDQRSPYVRATATDAGYEIDTGALRATVRRQGFNLLSGVTFAGQPPLPDDPAAGLYLVDHEGSVYRAANDRETTLTIEEQGPLRLVLRAAGWYVKDGTAGTQQSWTLPTEKLGQFICRLEFCAGQSQVRVLTTWVITSDSFTVRYRDVGLRLPLAGVTQATFGVEEGAPLTQAVPADGVRLVQHLPHAFALEDGAGKVLGEGKHSAGWASAASPAATLAIGHRETWQRFPKELEVRPDAVLLHLWPAHGREHPEIDVTAANEIHKLWFAHQGRELNFAQPWNTYFRVAQIEGDPSQGVYNGAGLALAGVHASSLGMALTSDVLLHYAPPGTDLAPAAAAFQAAPHLLADPAWNCASGAFGWVHPYDPERFATLEEIFRQTMRGYWETQDATGEYGMWLYRPWHHSTYLGEGRWKLYRLYNASHHYDAMLPWLGYFRSGDPFYLTQGLANMRLLSDAQTIHYDDPSYPQREFHFRQGRLVGSMRHTNGFNTWGGDHAVLAHLTCYGALINAYYLTGDLRLREVVESWQRTILTDRLNPQFAPADRSGNGDINSARDNSNPINELLDLYQLTHEPAILAHLGTMVPIFLNQQMRHWGQPLHHLLHTYRSAQAGEQLLAAVREHRATLGKPADPLGVWYTHAPHENWSLAAILDPTAGYQVDAFFACGTGQWLSRSRDALAQKPQAVTWCTVPDLLLYLPRVMYALANSPGGGDLQNLDASQAFPTGDSTQGGWTRVIVHEASDQAWAGRLLGVVGDDGIPLQVFGPDGAARLQLTVPAGRHDPYTFSVPADGQTGDYVIFLKARDVKERLRVPLTALPEVYHLGYWSQDTPTRFFTRAPGAAAVPLAITPHKSKGELLAADGATPLAATETGETLATQLTPEGAWVLIGSRYVHPKTPVTLAISPARWFAPTDQALAQKPAP
jgi:hypothetical protein